MKLSAEQKCDIAQRELEELREEIDKMKDDSERIIDNYKVCSISTLVAYLLQFCEPLFLIIPVNVSGRY